MTFSSGFINTSDNIRSLTTLLAIIEKINLYGFSVFSLLLEL